MALVSEERANEMLSEGSMVERIGSFLPPHRPGFDTTRYEVRVQESVAKKLYDKRVTIARRMASSPSKDIDTVVNSALVSCDISPNSVTHYDKYIMLLVERQGGWDRWRSQIHDEINRIDEAKKSIRKTMIPIILALILSLIVGGLGNNYLPNSNYFFLVPTIMTILTIVYASSIGSRKVSEQKGIIEEAAGSRKKQPKDFFPYTKVR